MSDITLVKEAAPGTPSANQSVIYVDTSDDVLKIKDETPTVHTLFRATKSFFIDANAFLFGGEQGGTAPNEMPLAIDLGTLPNQMRAVSLTDAICSGVNIDFYMPLDAATATLLIRPVWVPGSTDAVSHSVAWRMAVKIVTAADVTAAGTAISWTGTAAARTANVTAVEAGQATTAVTPTAADYVRLALSRDGNVAADSYVGDVQLLGIRIDYTSND